MQVIHFERNIEVDVLELLIELLDFLKYFDLLVLQLLLDLTWGLLVFNLLPQGALVGIDCFETHVQGRGANMLSEHEY